MTLDQLQPFARRYLKRYVTHPDFDDLTQEAVLRLWKASERYGGLTKERQEQIYASVLWKAARDFLRSPQNRARAYGRHGGQVIQPLSLEALAEEARLEGRHAFLGVTPDFVPALIERLQVGQLLTSLVLTPRQRIVFERVIVGGASGEVVAAQLGCSANRVHQIAAALRRQLRQSAGMSEPLRGYRGVYRCASRYGARIRIGLQKRYFQKWATAEEAALVVDAAIIAYGVLGPLNLLPDSARG